MLTKTYSFGITGLDAYLVTIEVDVSGGLPGTIIVGLPDNSIKESRERVRSAIRNSGFSIDPQKITINLSPADTKKAGSAFDVAIALGILQATDKIAATNLNHYGILGELSLDGKLRAVPGALAIALECQKTTLKGLIVPADNAGETALAGTVPIYPVQTLTEAIQFLAHPEQSQPFRVDMETIFHQANHFDIDFLDVKGQTYVKRGLEIAAAGGHNVLLIGPPGSGKSMLAKRLPTILPDMTLPEALEITKIHSSMGLLKPGQSIIATRPFRSPHHTSSDIAVVGGGSQPKAGEVTLSHHGVLFLDEFPEFRRQVLEALRQPLEDKHVTISRAIRSVRFPAKFMLIAAMNPCPCGALGQLKTRCRCSSLEVVKYHSKISGPLLDRIDIHLDVPSVNFHELSTTASSESSAQIKERVNKTRAVQLERFQGDNDVLCNAQMSHKQTQKFCTLGKTENDLLRQAMSELNLSARAYDKILRVARTIADLDGKEDIQTAHLAEAIQYRSLDRAFFG